jgi:hypothetical protein
VNDIHSWREKPGVAEATATSKLQQGPESIYRQAGKFRSTVNREEQIASLGLKKSVVVPGNV